MQLYLTLIGYKRFSLNEVSMLMHRSLLTFVHRDTWLDKRNLPEVVVFIRDRSPATKLSGLWSIYLLAIEVFSFNGVSKFYELRSNATRISQ